MSVLICSDFIDLWRTLCSQFQSTKTTQQQQQQQLLATHDLTMGAKQSTETAKTAVAKEELAIETISESDETSDSGKKPPLVYRAPSSSFALLNEQRS
jgi:hypothetical protein